MKKQDWEIRLQHEKDVRDALATCNDVDPASFVDPPGGMQLWRPVTYVYDGKTFHGHLNKTGHSTAAFDTCKCRAEAFVR